ncbi:MAG: DNA polymerase thumb domain-containing protein [Bacillota bacterium]
MIDYGTLPKHDVLCIDMKSFYASCECAARQVDPLNAYLAVIGDKSYSGSIVLASTPRMKKEYGIKTGSRLFQIPKDPKIHLVEARMALYLNQSVQITRFLNEFAPLEAIHTYSVDEFWLCSNGTHKLFGDKWELAEKIKKGIYERFKLPCCIGIGPNKFLAKVILDVEAKEKGIAECRYEDVSRKLWSQPVEKIWGIGRRMKRRLNMMGILTLGHLANYPLDQLNKVFGILGDQLYWHAWGIDLSPVTAGSEVDVQKGFGHGITLLRDYKNIEEIKTVILELSEEIARRARQAKMAGKTVSLGLVYSYGVGRGGFFRSSTQQLATNITVEIYQTALKILSNNYSGEAVRQVHLSLTNLSLDRAIQLSLFDDRLKAHNLGYAIDEIRNKFGSKSLLRAQSYTRGGIMPDRTKKIGGHKAL